MVTVSRYYLGIGLLLVAVAASAAWWSVSRTPGPSGIDIAIAYVAVALQLVALLQLNALVCLLTGFQQMHVGSLLHVIASAGGTALAIAGAWASGTVAAVALGYLTAQCLAFAVARRLTRELRDRTAGGGLDVALLRQVLHDGGNYLVYSLSYVVLMSDILLVGWWLGPAAAATYGVAFRVIDYLVQIVWRLSDATFPVVAEQDARGDRRSLAPAYHLVSKVSLAVAVLLAGALWAVGHRGFALWVGESNVAAEPVVRALGLGLVVQSLVHANVVIPYGAGRMRAISIAVAVEAALKCLIAVALMPTLGLLALPLATISAQLSCSGWVSRREAGAIVGSSWSDYTSQVLAPTIGPLALAVGVAGTITLASSGSSAAQLVAWVAGALVFGSAFSRYGLSTVDRSRLRAVLTGPRG